MTADLAKAATPSTNAEHNRARIVAGLEAWRTGTGSPYDLLAEDAVWTITGNSLGAGVYRGKEAFMAEVIRPFNARMQSPLVPSIRQIFAEGDTVIAFFDASGTARDGKPYANTYAWFLEMQGGMIVRAHAFFDAVAFDDLWRRVKPTRNTLP